MSSAHRWYLPSVRAGDPSAEIAPAVSPSCLSMNEWFTFRGCRPSMPACVLLGAGPTGEYGAGLTSVPGCGEAIEPIEPSVTLTVPCIDAANGRPQPASTGAGAHGGHPAQVTVDLLNDADGPYGSLSTAGFQSEPARLGE